MALFLLGKKVLETVVWIQVQKRVVFQAIRVMAGLRLVVWVASLQVLAEEVEEREREK